MKLHRMTWGELQKHNKYVDSRYNLDKVIPETYWFESNGHWYEVSKGGVGWNIYDDAWHNVGFAETLKELRKDSSF